MAISRNQLWRFSSAGRFAWAADPVDSTRRPPALGVNARPACNTSAGRLRENNDAGEPGWREAA